jgi:hypothetical protein
VAPPPRGQGRPCGSPLWGPFCSAPCCPPLPVVAPGRMVRAFCAALPLWSALLPGGRPWWVASRPVLMGGRSPRRARPASPPGRMELPFMPGRFVLLWARLGLQWGAQTAAKSLLPRRRVLARAPSVVSGFRALVSPGKGVRRGAGSFVRLRLWVGACAPGGPRGRPPWPRRAGAGPWEREGRPGGRVRAPRGRGAAGAGRQETAHPRGGCAGPQPGFRGPRGYSTKSIFCWVSLAPGRAARAFCGPGAGFFRVYSGFGLDSDRPRLYIYRCKGAPTPGGPTSRQQTTQLVPGPGVVPRSGMRATRLVPPVLERRGVFPCQMAPQFIGPAVYWERGEAYQGVGRQQQE